MPSSATARWRSPDRTTSAFAVLTLVAFAVAAAARAVVELTTSAAGETARYVTASPAGWDAFDTANAVAAVGACSAGAGVLLFGATLVLAVRGRRSPRLPVALGFVTLAMVSGAVVAGVLAAQERDFDVVAGLAILRTALAGLAVACLPALCLAALRARAARAR